MRIGQDISRNATAAVIVGIVGAAREEINYAEGNSGDAAGPLPRR